MATLKTNDLQGKVKVERLLAQPTAPSYVNGYSRLTIKNSKFTFENLIYYHLASMVVLAEQGLVSHARARRLIGAFRDIRCDGQDALEIDPALEDLQPNIEKAVIKLIGTEDAGDVGIGRARAEFGHVAGHLSVRDTTLATIDEQLRMVHVLLDVASQNLETIVPYYTQHMRAEPITFGYYFSSCSEAFIQHIRRLKDAYERLGLSPAGAGHIVPTPLPIDRVRLAELLGLREPALHSLYAYLNADCFVDVLGVASNTAASISRLCMDFWWWASNELDLISFGDAWCGGSFIMPHKRNPSWLKPLRFSAMAVKARHDEALELWMHSSPMWLVGSLNIPWIAHEGLGALRYCCELLCEALPEMIIDKKRGRLLSEEDFIQSSQLVSMIVGRKQASWRQAELVVGGFVKEAAEAGRTPSSLKFERLIEIGLEVLHKSLVLDKDEFEMALDIEAIVKSRGDSGPAPMAVSKAVETQLKMIQEFEEWVQKEKQRINSCRKKVEDLADQI